MQSEQVSKSIPDRASEGSRRQRDGTEFIGGYGRKTGDSDLRFIEGQLPEHGGRVESDESPAQQLELALQNLETTLNQRGQRMDDVLQLTLYLADMDAYESVNETYERYFEDTYPARTTVGACELLGGAAVTVDAVAALE
ncbi:RidA family protein [Halococcus thailandensis]|uniref:Endoribonuclease L-PSP n=1 Tax=Halococcus thailandensis JCM 13552 TaxID=1227457 RepID=M0NFC6_9EURY|nr:RidA family protein [Halococcus thailandensis]EMA56677.1 endoribonuclease L-PSP [Halococcus thailandensis JCM 13552]